MTRLFAHIKRMNRTSTPGTDLWDNPTRYFSQVLEKHKKEIAGKKS